MLLIITRRQQAHTGNVLGKLRPMVSLLLNPELSKLVWPQNIFYPLLHLQTSWETIIPQNILQGTLNLEVLAKSAWNAIDQLFPIISCQCLPRKEVLYIRSINRETNEAPYSWKTGARPVGYSRRLLPQHSCNPLIHTEIRHI